MEILLACLFYLGLIDAKLGVGFHVLKCIVSGK